MEKKVSNTIKKYSMINAGDRIAVGLSGGADSVAMLIMLNKLGKEYGLTLFAVHVNHGIRGEEAERDCDFAKRLCGKLGISFTVKYFDIPAEAKSLGLTEEECGRVMRYRAFNEIAEEKGCNKIAVAHNLNDQSETVIMRLARGTGLTGLRGISPVRDNIIRPLIECTRDEIEAYLKEFGQSYCIDSTNLAEDYTRNKTRLRILPYMEKEINKNAVTNIAKTAMLLAEEDDYLENEAHRAYLKALEKETADGVYLKEAELKELNTVILRRVIRRGFRYFKRDIKDLGYGHTEYVISLINSESGKSVNLPAPFGARKEYGFIVLTGNPQKEIKDFCYILTEDTIVFVKELGINVEISRKEIKNVGNCHKVCTKAFNYDKINLVLEVRNRRAGDFIALNAYGGRKKLKDFFIDEKIPRSERNKIPLIACGNRILWVVGKRQGADCIPDKKDKNILYIRVWEDYHND